MQQNQKGVISITYFPHAATVDNEAGISTGRFDAKISALGKKQILELKDKVSNKNFDLVFCSDLTRAVETARGAFENTHIIVDPRLTEIDVGDFTGKKVSFTEPISTQYIDLPFPGGESWKNVEDRVRDFLKDLAKNYASKNIVIVGHQGTQLSLEVILNKVTWEEALKNDWRKRKAFQYGWDYEYRFDQSD